MENKSLVIDHNQIKKAIGLLGVTFPLILVVGAWLLDGCSFIQPSLSQYYYTIMGDVFVGIIFAISIFLFSYKGYPNSNDNLVANLSCVFGLCTAFFPTDMKDGTPCNYTLIDHEDYFSTIHFISAALFFLSFAYFSICLFTKTDPKIAPTPQKLFRNKIYKTCGYLIILFLVLILLVFKVPNLKDSLATFKPVFVLESLCLLAFGFAWLVKGEFIFRDKIGVN